MEYVRDLKFEEVHIYKIAKNEETADGELSPSGSSEHSSGGNSSKSDEGGAGEAVIDTSSVSTHATGMI
jgi:hypothetical protein